jgi:hypothetical protein
VFVTPPGFAEDADLARWLERGVAFAASLPPGLPADSDQRGADASGLGRPLAVHAAAKVSKLTLTGSLGPSPCSK